MPETIWNKVFDSYSHKDKRLFEEFKTMLAPAIRDGIVEVWDDKQKTRVSAKVAAANPPQSSTAFNQLNPCRAYV